jgi:glutamyl-tRNA synthetase
VDAVKVRARTIVQLAERVAVRLDASRLELDAKAEQLRQKMGPQFGASLGLARAALAGLPPAEWNADDLLTVLRGAAAEHSVKLGDLMQPVRVALTGTTVSEPVNELLAVVGRDESLKRLAAGAERWDGDGRAA